MPLPYLAAITFNGESWSTALEFNKRLFRVHPNSKLNAIALEENSAPSVRLYSQNIENDLQEIVFTAMQGWGTAEELTPRTISGLQPAMTGIGIAASCYPGTQNLFLFYQDVNGTLRQLVNEGLRGWTAGSHPTESPLTLALMGERKLTSVCKQRYINHQRPRSAVCLHHGLPWRSGKRLCGSRRYQRKG